jgi:uncharacterized protein YjbJ (UPF0337 family)
MIIFFPSLKVSAPPQIVFFPARFPLFEYSILHFWKEDSLSLKGDQMSKDIMKGEKDRIKGKLRSAYGKAIGSPRQRMKGKYEQSKGTVRKKIGKAKYRI